MLAALRAARAASSATPTTSQASGEAFFDAARGARGSRASSPSAPTRRTAAAGARATGSRSSARARRARDRRLRARQGLARAARRAACSAVARRRRSCTPATSAAASARRALDALLRGAASRARRPTPAFEVRADPPARGAVFVEPRARRRGALHRGDRARPAAPAGARPAARRQRRRATRSPTGAAAARARGDAAPAPPPAAPRTGRRPAALHAEQPSKIFWPVEGYTKGDLLAYYDAIWPRIAPYLRDRPVVLTRYPDGIDGKSLLPEERARVHARLGADLPASRTPSTSSATSCDALALRDQPRAASRCTCGARGAARSSGRTG